MTKPLQSPRQHDGDPEASVGRSFLVRRFTLDEHDRGDTAGWRLWAGWFTRHSGLTWAWFRREVDRDAS